MVTCTGHIGIHEGADGRTDVRTYVRTLYVRTDVHDVMAIKPNFLTSMGYHIFLSMVLRARAPSARAELRYETIIIIPNKSRNKISKYPTINYKEITNVTRLTGKDIRNFGLAVNSNSHFRKYTTFRGSGRGIFLK